MNVFCSLFPLKWDKMYAEVLAQTKGSSTSKKWNKILKQHSNIFLEPVLTSPVITSHSYRATTNISKTRVIQEKCY